MERLLERRHEPLLRKNLKHGWHSVVVRGAQVDVRHCVRLSARQLPAEVGRSISTHACGIIDHHRNIVGPRGIAGKLPNIPNPLQLLRLEWPPCCFACLTPPCPLTGGEPQCRHRLRGRIGRVETLELVLGSILYNLTRLLRWTIVPHGLQETWSAKRRSAPGTW